MNPYLDYNFSPAVYSEVVPLTHPTVYSIVAPLPMDYLYDPYALSGAAYVPQFNPDDVPVDKIAGAIAVIVKIFKKVKTLL